MPQAPNRGPFPPPSPAAYNRSQNDALSAQNQGSGRIDAASCDRAYIAAVKRCQHGAATRAEVPIRIGYQQGKKMRDHYHKAPALAQHIANNVALMITDGNPPLAFFASGNPLSDFFR
jgi:hypothetical protein